MPEKKDRTPENIAFYKDQVRSRKCVVGNLQRRPTEITQCLHRAKKLTKEQRREKVQAKISVGLNSSSTILSFWLKFFPQAFKAGKA